MDFSLTRRQFLGGMGALALPLGRLGGAPNEPTPLKASSPDLGSVYELIDKLGQNNPAKLTFLSEKWSSLDAWKSVARPEFISRLSYAPPELPLSAQLVHKETRDGFIVETVRISATSAYDIPARVLIPSRSGQQRSPAVLALHCHSGDYSWGHEKVLSSSQDSAALTKFRQRDGRPWAEDLARRGYVVIIIDAFYFGERRLQVERLDRAIVPEFVADAFQRATSLPRGSEEQLDAIDRVCSFLESETAKALFAAGFTWPGLQVWDDRRSLDYLLTRPEVDPERIGCAGLSLGGLRGAHLIGADERIRAACVTGWMSELRPMVHSHLHSHTWMAFVPGLYGSLDLPDVAALHAPGALLVQQCRQDRLFPMEGMTGAVDKISAIYAKAGLSDRFRGSFHNVGHSFVPDMQQECFEWFDRWL